MSHGGIIDTWRALFSLRRVIVTFGVASTIGVVEWMGLGHPIGLVFGLVMGLGCLLLAPLPWLWILPWGLRRPPAQIALRALGVLVMCTAVVCAAFALFFAVQSSLVPPGSRSLWNALPHLSAWSSVLISIPLFAAAGWGLSRHLELERRLEVRDVREVALLGALEEARMMALQSRLDPHFLFNALNLVAELCRDEPAEAERCVVRLSALLRSALEHGDRPTIELGRELDLCADYLELCRVRFGDRLQVELSREPAAEHVRTPLFSVQVLCENAVHHGVERATEGGTVRVVSTVEQGSACVEVISPGAFRGERPGGKGLELTRRRLALAHGDAARLEVRTTDDGQGTLARLSLPLSTANKEQS